MKMVMRVVVAAALTFSGSRASAATCSAQSTPAVLPCEADALSCQIWRSFRAAHPVPYQTVAVDLLPAGDTVLIISEPPPVGSMDELRSLLASVFGGASVVAVKFPIGADGWLQDFVVHFHSTGTTSIDVATAESTAFVKATMQVPTDVADRLRYVGYAFYGTDQPMYVDEVKGPSPQFHALAPLDLTALDARTLIAARSWYQLGGSPNRVAWEAVSHSAVPEAFIDEQSQTVALVIPARTDAVSLDGSFRAFAIASDYLLGAFAPAGGGLVLLGRNRMETLSALPPMRFETVMSVLGRQGTDLEQSYERQRVLAGKVFSGDYVGWDWAPASLSPALQDTEFGVLLDQADQELKSWSEHGRVRYAGFIYPDPPVYPFGSESVTESLEADELIFNWNTNAFTFVTPVTAGKVLSIARTGSLSVSYIVTDPTARLDAAQASDTGTKYFSETGDPILARVARNVLLYQALNMAGPALIQGGFRSVPASRTEAITKVLTDESLNWLTAAVNTGDRHVDGVAQVVRDSHLSLAELARLMAAPETGDRAIMSAIATIHQRNNAILDLAQQEENQRAQVERLIAVADAAARRACRGRSGNVLEQIDGFECRYSAGPFDMRIDFDSLPEVRTQKRAEGELDDIDRRIGEASAARAVAVDRAEKQQAFLKAANQTAALLRPAPAFSSDLSGVLDRVLSAARGIPTERFIRTPSIVMSCNARDVLAIGGHNIDARPTQPPATILGITTLPPDSLRLRPPPLRTTHALPELIGLKPVSGSFLERVGEARIPPSTVEPSLLERAKLCHCDTYVERDGAGSVASVVELGPPPTVRSVFGTTLLADVLAEKSGSRRVMFSGFDEQTATDVSLAAAQRSKKAPRVPGSRGSRLEGLIETGKRLFGRDTSGSGTSLAMKTSSGKIATVAPKIPAADLKALLEARPDWKNAQIESGSDGVHLLHVTFDSQGTNLDVQAYDALGQSVRSEALSTVALSSARTVLRGNLSVREVVERLGDRLTREDSVGEVRFFLEDAGKIVILDPEKNERALVMRE
jgi:hypothetical protein